MWAVGQGHMKWTFYRHSTHCTAMQKEQALEPVCKRVPLLNPNQISELIMDIDSNKPLCNVAAMEDKAYCEEILLEPHLWSLSEYTAWSSAKAPLSLDSASTSEEEDDVQSGPDPRTQQPPKSQWTLPSRLQQRVAHALIGGPRGKMTVTHHTSTMALCHLVFSHISQRLSHCLWWRLPDIITGARTVLMWDLLPNLICVQNVCVSGNNNTNGTVLHSILQQYDEMKQICTHTSVSGVCRQQEWSWQDRRQLWQTM